LFGTTTTQIASLFYAWGDERGKRFMDDLKKNSIKISTSNGESADLVASGEFDFSLVDSDDAINRMRQGKPVEMGCPDQGASGIGCLILPNAVALLKGAPHAENARKLIDYLLSPQTERKLAFADCAQIPLHPSVETPADVLRLDQIKTMQIDYAVVSKKLQDIQPFLKRWIGY
jgi:iron(III) transport system substrate-binding protein